MSVTSPFGGRNPQLDQIATGGLAYSTATRLRELTGWGGSTSFFSPSGLTAGAAAGIHPVAQVVGLAAGELRPGYVLRDDRWQRPVAPETARHFTASEPALSDARWQEHPRIVRDWDMLRRRAMNRLRRQAEQLGCQAVVGIEPRRQLDWADEGGEAGAVIQFTGTAVRIDGWSARRTAPVLTLAGVGEVARLIARGVEPAGIVGGVGRIELRPSDLTVTVSRRSGFQWPASSSPI